MRDIGSRLKDADPVPHETGLTAADLRVMRQRVLAAARMSDISRGVWERLAIATAVALILAAALTFDRRDPAVDDVDETAGSAAASGVRRQLQFATPGGTRVIWVFNSRFEP